MEYRPQTFEELKLDENANHLLAEFADVIGEEYVLSNGEDKEPYLTDWGKRFKGNALAILRPKNTSEVAALVKICKHHRVPIVPQGGNTGLCGGATPDASGHAVVICLRRLNQIQALDLEN